MLVPRLRVSTHLRRGQDGPGGPRPLTARERRRLETRGLDADGVDAYAEETHDQRWQQHRDRAHQASLWEGILLDTLRDFAALARMVSA